MKTTQQTSKPKTRQNEYMIRNMWSMHFEALAWQQISNQPKPNCNSIIAQNIVLFGVQCDIQENLSQTKHFTKTDMNPNRNLGKKKHTFTHDLTIVQTVDMHIYICPCESIWVCHQNCSYVLTMSYIWTPKQYVLNINQKLLCIIIQNRLCVFEWSQKKPPKFGLLFDQKSKFDRKNQQKKTQSNVLHSMCLYAMWNADTCHHQTHFPRCSMLFVKITTVNR